MLKYSLFVEKLCVNFSGEIVFVFRRLVYVYEKIPLEEKVLQLN